MVRVKALEANIGVDMAAITRRQACTYASRRAIDPMH
jgi:hypothetical protein